MSAQTRLTLLTESLSNLIETAFPNPEPEAEHLLAELSTLASDLQMINPAMRQICDLNGAFTLMAQLLDAAHAEKVDADQMKCLLDPMRERLELSTAELSSVLC